MQIPTFNPSGWVSDPRHAMSEIVAAYFANKRAQSDFYHVNSIARDIAENIEDPTGLADAIERALTAMHQAYFGAGVEVNASATLKETPNRHYVISLSIITEVNGKQYSFGQTYEQYDGGFKRIMGEQ